MIKNIIWLDLKSEVRRFGSDLGKEIVVLISAAVLMGLFTFMFADFLQLQMSRLPDVYKQSAMRYAALALLVVIAAFCLSSARKLSTDDFSIWLRTTPHPHRIVVVAIMLRIVLRSTLFFGIGFLLATYLSLPLQPIEWIATAMMMMAAVLTQSWWGGYGLQRQRQLGQRALQDSLIPRLRHHGAVVLWWRVSQMALRNRRIQIIEAISLLAFVIALGLYALSQQLLLSYPWAVFAGFLSASCLCFQLSEDLAWAASEQSMGMSHEWITRVYNQLAWISTAVFVIVALTASLFLTFYLDGLTAFLAALQIALIAASLPCIAPALLFQIDPRKPFVQVLSILLVGLFVSTAVFVHVAFFVLVPVANYYLAQSQVDRYYRA